MKMHMISKYLTAVALVGASAGATAQIYDVTEIGSLGGSSSYTNWGSVNDSGQITGYSYIAGDQAYQAFIYSSGTTQALATAANSQGFGINDAGQVTGLTASCGFVSEDGEIQVLNNLLGVCGSSATASSTGVAINAAGNIAGYSTAKGGGVHAVYFSQGKIKDLGTLGGTDSYGYGVNGGGQVTGYSALASGGATHAFVTQSGGLVDIGTLGGSDSVGYGINGSGEITGNSQLAGNTVTHAFLYNSGTMHDLGGLGGTFSTGLAIDAAGQVVGTANNASGEPRAFLFSAGNLVNLNTLISPSSALAPYVTLTSATGISNTTGYIAANGTDSRYPGVNEVFLLTPTNALPTVTPKITGTQGNNGWYVTPTTLSWVVTGGPPPTTSGCQTVSVPDTKGTTYTCTATNSVGTWSNSVTIKKDTVPPTETITSPTKGESFRLNQSAGADYTCTDATSSVFTCSGAVGSQAISNGGKLPTSVKGSFTFTVTSTDVAGNQSTTSVNYSVK